MTPEHLEMLHNKLEFTRNELERNREGLKFWKAYDFAAGLKIAGRKSADIEQKILQLEKELAFYEEILKMVKRWTPKPGEMIFPHTRRW
jgi:rubrerythrin